MKRKRETTKTEGGRFREKSGVCEQGLRPSVCCGLSSEVDDALGEQLRCRAFRLHHYCSPSSSSTNTLPHTNTHTHNAHTQTHTHKYTHSSHKHAKALIVASVLLHQCLLTRFCMPGQVGESDFKSHVLIFKLVSNN